MPNRELAKAAAVKPPHHRRPPSASSRDQESTDGDNDASSDPEVGSNENRGVGVDAESSSYALSADVPPDVTLLLGRMRRGDRQALDQLLPLVYDELRRIARGQRQRIGGRQLTVNTTALVHEAYLKLSSGKTSSFADRGHFFAVAATAMRQLLIDEAKRHTAQKRGSGRRPISLDSVEVGVATQAESLLELDQALIRLGDASPRLLRVVECRFFGGLTESETAEALSITDRTVRRDWVKARAWLAVEMGVEADPEG